MGRGVQRWSSSALDCGMMQGCMQGAPVLLRQRLPGRAAWGAAQAGSGVTELACPWPWHRPTPGFGCLFWLRTGNAMLESDAVRKIGFTGSTAVGKQLMAGAAATVKRVSLELARLPPPGSGCALRTCAERGDSSPGALLWHHCVKLLPAPPRSAASHARWPALNGNSSVRPPQGLSSAHQHDWHPARGGQTPGSPTPRPVLSPVPARARAATRPTSSSTTRMWTRRRPASSPRPSAMPARPASAPTASSCRRAGARRAPQAQAVPGMRRTGHACALMCFVAVI